MHHLQRHVLLKLLEKISEISSVVLSSMAEGIFMALNQVGNISYLIFVCWKGTSFRI
jgi:hypothetical protein